MSSWFARTGVVSIGVMTFSTFTRINGWIITFVDVCTLTNRERGINISIIKKVIIKPHQIISTQCMYV